MNQVRVLLSEGSSLSAREAVTALGRAGHRLELCDPDPVCLSRFSLFVKDLHRGPSLGADPLGYLKFVTALVETGNYDVLYPAHEQAFLFSRVRETLSRHVGLAVPDFAAFLRVQSKVKFFATLAEIGVPHPETRIVRGEAELRACPFPYFLKTEYGNASTGVWPVDKPADLEKAMAALRAVGQLDDAIPLLVQLPAVGKLERLQAVFDNGRFVAWHGYAQVAEGVNGGDVVKVSVLRDAARDCAARLGAHLQWHGALSLDYFFDEATGVPQIIDGNPRLVEPMNAFLSGVNLPDVLVRVSRGERVEAVPPGRAGVVSHLTIMALFDAAAHGDSRLSILKCLARILLRRGEFAGSREELTPIRLDRRSGVPVPLVLARLLVNPAAALKRTASTVKSYSLSADAVRTILAFDTP